VFFILLQNRRPAEAKPGGCFPSPKMIKKGRLYHLLKEFKNIPSLVSIAVIYPYF